MQNSYAGVDGCRGGWFAVQLGLTGDWNTMLLKSPKTLVALIESSKLTLIDIPMGLPGFHGLQLSPQLSPRRKATQPHYSSRQCDHQARKALGMPRAASVFSVPCREAVYADSYAQASRLNHLLLGKKLSKQTWNISGKIRQVDELLQSDIPIREKLRECHPEVCFWALNHKNAMQFNKKLKAGREDRLRVLACHLPQANKIFECAADKYSRKEVGLDDIVDAMVLAVTAVYGYKSLSSFPQTPQLDSLGIRMEIAYWVPLPM